MFGFTNPFSREVDRYEFNNDGDYTESSPLSRAVEKAREFAVEVAAEVASDDQETVVNPPSPGWSLW